MRVLLTGATGYLGSVILRKLVEKQIETVIITRDHRAATYKGQSKTIVADLTVPESIDESLWGCDHIIHSAAYVKMSGPDPTLFYKINVEGTRNLLEKASLNNIKKLVHISTIGVRGPISTESSNGINARTIPLTNHYDESKSVAEHLVLQYAIHGLPVCIIRPPRIYGPGADTMGASLTGIINKFINGKWHLVPGDGSMIASYAYSDDVAAGVISAMIKGVHGKIYDLGGINASFNTFFDALKFVSGVNYRLYNVPGILMFLIATINELKNKIVNKPAGLTRAMVKKILSDNSVDSSEAVNDLDYNITGLEDGLLKTINWIKNEKLS